MPAFSPRLAVVLAGLLALPGTALAAEPTVKESPHSVADTAERLEAAVEEAGANVFASVDHGAGAQSVGQDLAPAILVVFGNPELGTPLMQADPMAGLDLPMKVLVREGENGTEIAYFGADALAERWDLDGEEEVLERIDAALDSLTDTASAED